TRPSCPEPTAGSSWATGSSTRWRPRRRCPSADMPKIEADTIAEHVARRETAVVEAAARLFAEHGVPNVTLGQIATEVGIARNSIYRYFPDKAHIVAAWFRADLEPLLEACAEIAARDEPAAQRLR